MGAFMAKVEKDDSQLKGVVPQQQQLYTVELRFLGENGAVINRYIHLSSSQVERILKDDVQATSSLLQNNPAISDFFNIRGIAVNEFIWLLKQQLSNIKSARESGKETEQAVLDLTNAKMAIMNVSVSTQTREELSADYVRLMRSAVMRLAAEEIKEDSEVAKYLAEYLQKRYGVRAALVKAVPVPLIGPLFGDDIAKKIIKELSKRINALVKDEMVRKELLAILDDGAKYDSLIIVGTLSKLMDTIESKDEKEYFKNIFELSGTLKSSFYPIVPISKITRKIETSVSLTGQYVSPTLSFVYGKQTNQYQSKAGAVVYGDMTGYHLGLSFGLQDMVLNWNILSSSFKNPLKPSFDPTAGILSYGALGIGIDPTSGPYLFAGAYQCNFQNYSGFSFRMPGVMLGVMLAITAVQSGIQYGTTADFGEYAVVATMLRLYEYILPLKSFMKVMTLIDLMIPEIIKDDVGIPEFLAGLHRAEAMLRAGEYNKALQEIEAMIDSSQKSTTKKDPIARYVLFMVEDLAIESEIVHFGEDASPSRTITKRVTSTMQKMKELNEKIASKEDLQMKDRLSEAEWREYVGIMLYLSSKMVIQMEGELATIYPSHINPEQFVMLAKILAESSKNLFEYVSFAIVESTLYRDDPLMAFGLGKLKDMAERISPEKMTDYLQYLARDKKVEVDLNLFSWLLNDYVKKYSTEYNSNSIDAEMRVLLGQLESGKHPVFEYGDTSAEMEEYLYKLPMREFFETDDIMQLAGIEQKFPLYSLLLWGRENEHLGELLRSDKRFQRLAKAEQKLLKRLQGNIYDDLIDFESGLEYSRSVILDIYKESAVDFGDLDSPEIPEKSLKKYYEKYPLAGLHFRLEKRIEDAYKDVADAFNQFQKALKDLEANSPTDELLTRVQVSYNLYLKSIEALNGAVEDYYNFFYQLKLNAKYANNNEDDTDYFSDRLDNVLDLKRKIMERYKESVLTNATLQRYLAIRIAEARLAALRVEKSVPNPTQTE